LEFSTVKYGHLRKWLHFRGVSDYVIRSDSNDALVSDTMTIITHVKDYPWEGACPILTKSASANFYSFWLGYISFSSKRLSFAVRDEDKNSYEIILGILDNFSGMLAAVADGQYLKGYINDKLVAQGSYSGTILKNGYDFKIAMGYNIDYVATADVYFVALYNRALSDTEISQMYDYVVNGEGEMITDGLVLWYDGDSIDPVNGIWRDKSGNNNDGIIHGAIYNSNWGTIKYGTIHYGA